MSDREQRVVEAQRLRDSGLKRREIAERMGVSPRTVSDWLWDPDGSRLRARKDSYRGTCEECGGPTDGGRGRGMAPKVSTACRKWTEAEIIAAMQRWAHEHGGVPPTTTEWRNAGDYWPCATAVKKYGGWNTLLLKAGLALRRDCRPETQAEMERMLESGMSVSDVADHFGWLRENVYLRLRTRGRTVAEVRARGAASDA